MHLLRLIVLGTLGAVVLVGALLWILQLTLRLEREEQESRRIAQREERVRLALWRMDSALAAFLARENALPVDPPMMESAPGDAATTPPFLLKRFEMTAASADEEPDLPQLDDLLELLQQPDLHPEAARFVGSQTRPPPMPQAELQTEPRTEPQTPPTAEAPSIDAAGVDMEIQQQALRNRFEFSQRQQVALQQIPPQQVSQQQVSQQQVSQQQVSQQQVSQRQVPQKQVTPQRVTPQQTTPPTQGRLDEALPDDGPDTETGPGNRVLRALQPLWLNDRLLLVRRVERQGAEALQGLILDTSSSREWLLGQVQDLVPNSDLVPVLPEQVADPGRQLALLPWRLVVDDGAMPRATARSSLRLSLTLALSAIGVVLLGIGATVVAGLRLARRRSDFASAVIHELRTPLTTFRFYTDMLAEGNVPVAEQPRYLETLRQEADRLGHLVENVLAYARLERTKAPPPSPLELGPWLGEVMERLKRRSRDSGFLLEVSAGSELAEVHVVADALALERILLNLCDNSCKYATGDRRLELRVERRDHQVAIDWRDHGPGIPRQAWSQLFRPFHRHTDTAQETLGGIGLGLALSRQLARRWGGDLRPVEPTDGDGICLRLLLPIADPG